LFCSERSKVRWENPLQSGREKGLATTTANNDRRHFADLTDFIPVTCCGLQIGLLVGSHLSKLKKIKN